MDFVYAMLVLGGAVALLLWGAHMVQTGVQRAFGPRLQAFLGRHLRRRLVAFSAGIGITLLLQSSTATGLMATGFAAGALVDLVPALAEQHAAHKARLARMAGVITPPAVPLPFAEPPRKGVVVPPPIELSGTRKHQIAILDAAGWSQAKIARRLKLTSGIVAGVLYRARAEAHKLLLCDVCFMLSDLGFDTYEIGGLVGEPEHVVYNLAARGRDRERASR